MSEYASIGCRLDDGNSFLHGIADGQLQRLQSVQNTTARLVTGTRRPEHISPVVIGRIVNTVATATDGSGVRMTWRLRISSGIAGRRILATFGRKCLEMPRTRTTFADKSFAVACPRVWNSLPVVLRDASLTL